MTKENSLTEDRETWYKSSLVSVNQISPSGLKLLFSRTKEMKQLVEKSGGDKSLQHHVLGTVFYEPSTRTCCSFQAAMLRLGGTFIHVDASSKSGSSSTKKGESLSDTIRSVASYVDVVVLRHFQAGSIPNLVKHFTTTDDRPIVINAGDGTGEHPTQALLDVFTIMDELKLFNFGSSSFVKEHVVITLLGDLKHSRTVHSLVLLLARSQGLGLGLTIHLHYCSPPSLKMPEELIQQVQLLCPTIKQNQQEDIKKPISSSHVLYVTRLQKERFDNPEEYEQLKGSYIIDSKLLKDAPDHMIVMHPLPRVDEISPDVDSDPRAAYFRQMQNGMFLRMAILALTLGK